jgi:hypothetical protein
MKQFSSFLFSGWLGINIFPEEFSSVSEEAI